MGTLLRNPVFFLDIEGLRLEVILDNGFLNHYSLSTTIHAHTYYELILCPQGDILVENPDGSGEKLQTGAGCLIPPGTYHRIRGLSPGARKLAIRFYSPETPATATYAAFFARMDGCRPVLPLGQQPALLQLATALHQDLLAQTIGSQAYVQALLTQLFILLMRQICADLTPATPRESPGQPSTRRLAIDEYMSNHYHQPITEETLADQVHLSKRQLSRVLRQLYGKSFRQLLIDIRLSQAAQLLVTTDLTATEIAGRVGYGSDSGFYEAFKKRFGISVQKYRKEKIRQWDNV